MKGRPGYQAGKPSGHEEAAAEACPVGGSAGTRQEKTTEHASMMCHRSGSSGGLRFSGFNQDFSVQDLCCQPAVDQVRREGWIGRYARRVARCGRIGRAISGQICDASFCSIFRGRSLWSGWSRCLTRSASQSQAQWCRFDDSMEKTGFVEGRRGMCLRGP